MTAPTRPAVESFLDGKVVLHPGDCLDALRTLPANSVDSCCTDPPYHLTANKKGGSGVASVNLESPYGRSRIGTGNGSGGFMGKAWDGGDIAFRVELWAEVFRVLKPGAHLVAFSGTRTYHRMVCAIEDAGFEIRDQIGWAFGQGFPKSRDVSKAIDKAAGAEREVLRERYTVKRIKPGATVVADGAWGKQDVPYTATDTAPATREAAQWQGWGTALKPAWEPIVLARKPLIGTVAENVLKHGTGAINIDGCRVEASDNKTFDRMPGDRSREQYRTGTTGASRPTDLGRWPANIIHDGSDEVVGAFPSAPGQMAAVGPQHGAKPSVNTYGDYGPPDQFEPRGDSGSAARFFYTAKADADDRLGSKHPTVKPLDLMQWLVRLVTPPGGTVLDPFAGTGTAGEAAWREGFRAILIEREAEYQNDIRRRMAHVFAGPIERKHTIAKLKPTPIQTGNDLFSRAAE